MNILKQWFGSRAHTEALEDWDDLGIPKKHAVWSHAPYAPLPQPCPKCGQSAGEWVRYSRPRSHLMLGVTVEEGICHGCNACHYTTTTTVAVPRTAEGEGAPNDPPPEETR